MRDIKQSKKNKTFYKVIRNSFSNVRRSKSAVSEVVGAVMLLGIVAVLMSAVYLMVLSPMNSSESAAPPVEIVGTVIIDIDGDSIIFEHRGGPPLSSGVKITITYNEEDYKFSLSDSSYIGYLGSNQKWDIGEQIIYNEEEGVEIDVYGTWVKALIIDSSNKVLLNAVLQDGEVIGYPTVKTIGTTMIGSIDATLKGHYNLRDYKDEMVADSSLTCEVGFQYRKNIYTGWTTTPLQVLTGTSPSEDDYFFTISPLESETHYEYKAIVKYLKLGSLLPQGGEGALKEFTTGGDIIGQWHFTDNLENMAWDATVYDNDGVIYSANWTGTVPISIGEPSALYFDGVDDKVEVNSANSLNETDKFSIEAWIKPLEDDSYGDIDIVGVQDSTNYPLSCLSCNDPSMIQVSDDIYAIACWGYNYANTERWHGHLITVEINDDGEIIDDDIIDSWVFESSLCHYPKIINVSGNGSENIFAIVYTGRGGHVSKQDQYTPINGYIKTVMIYDNGSINKSFTGDSLQFVQNDNTCYDPDIIHVYNDSINSSHVYAIAYGGNATDSGHLITVNISNNGLIEDDVVFEVIFDNNPTTQNANYDQDFDLFYVYGDIYATMYRDYEPDGAIRTFEIKRSGVIIILFKGSDEPPKKFDAEDAANPNVIHIYDDETNNEQIFAVTFRRNLGIDNKLYVQTFSVGNDGSVINTEIEILEIWSYNGKMGTHPERFFYPESIHVDGDVYAISYQRGGLTGTGYIDTIQITESGEMTKISSHKWFANQCTLPDIIDIGENALGNNVYAIVYNGMGHDAIIKTIEIADDGSIVGSYVDIKDVLELGVVSWQFPDIIPVHESGDLYAVVYSDIDYDGIIKILEIDGDGYINNQNVFTFEFEDDFCYTPRIIKIDENGGYSYFAIIYRRPGVDGCIKTVKIQNDGTVSSIDDYVFDGVCYDYFDVCHIFDDVSNSEQIYAIVYRTSGNGGKIATVNITNAGIIKSTIDDYIFDSTYCYQPCISRVKDTIYAIAYRSREVLHYYPPPEDRYEYTYPGYLLTINIADNGSISNSILDSFKFQEFTFDVLDQAITSPTIIHINEDYFAIAYTKRERGSTASADDWYNGTLMTIEIDQDNGSINSQILDTYTFDGDYSYKTPDLIHITDDAYLIAYRGYGYDGIIKAVRISENNGDISDTYIDMINFDTGGINNPEIIHISTNGDKHIFALAFQGTDFYNAFVKTIEVYNNESTGLNANALIAKHDGNDGYGIYIDHNKVYGKIDNNVLSLDLTPDQWNYVVLTHDNASGIDFYINGGVTHGGTHDSQSYAQTIGTNPLSLIFGEFNVILDEITMYNRALTVGEVEDTWDKYINP